MGITNCLSMQYDTFAFAVYIIAVLLGAAQAILLITSLSIVAGLIDRDTVCFTFCHLRTMANVEMGMGDPIHVPCSGNYLYSHYCFAFAK